MCMMFIAAKTGNAAYTNRYIDYLVDDGTKT